eukprot:PhM_4_TR16683/c0_g1_i1/m.42705
MSSSLPVVVITGASSGIGEQAALQLAASKKYRLALLARRSDALAAVAARSGLPADDILTVTCDVTKRAEVQASVKTITDKFGTIDVWVNNAGRGLTKTFDMVTDEDIDDMMSVNVKSVLYCIQEVLPIFQQKAKGQFVNVSSLLGRNAEIAPMRSAYSGSKHFLNAMTCSLRAQFAEQYPEILFQTYSPGPVATDFGLAASGPDSRTFPNAQDCESTAARLVSESIEGKKLEAYSREEYHGTVGKYLASLTEKK